MPSIVHNTVFSHVHVHIHFLRQLGNWFPVPCSQLVSLFTLRFCIHSVLNPAYFQVHIIQRIYKTKKPRQRMRRPKTGPWSEFNAAILLIITLDPHEENTSGGIYYVRGKGGGRLEKWPYLADKCRAIIINLAVFNKDAPLPGLLSISYSLISWLYCHGCNNIEEV